MGSPLSTLAAAFALGLSLAAPPGPINILILNEAIRRSWLSGAYVGFGAATADFIFYLIVSHFGVKAFSFWFLRPILYAGGTAILAYISAALIFEGLGRRKAGLEVKDGGGAGYLKGLSIGLTNPLQIGWWAAVGVTLVYLFGSLFALGFFSGIFFWVFSFSYVSALFRYRLIRVFRALSIGSAVVLLGFAAFFAYRLISLLGL